MNSFRQLSRFAAALENCSACGICVSGCPMYSQMRRAAFSPRSLMALLKELLAGRLSEEEVREPLQCCLMCGLCDRACPAKLPLAAIFRAARHDLESGKNFGGRLLAEFLLPHPLFLKILWRGGSGMARLFRPKSQQQIALRERMPPKRRKERRKGEILLFAGCMATFARPSLLEACVSLLDYYKIEWALPEFACCGAFAANAGFSADARRGIRRNLKIFASSRPEQIIMPCPHCLAQIREVWAALAWLGEDERELAAQFASKSCGIGEFLNQQDGAPICGKERMDVYWHRPCLQPDSETVASMELLAKKDILISGMIAECCGNSPSSEIWPPILALQPVSRGKSAKGRQYPELLRSGLAKSLKRELKTRGSQPVAGSCPVCLVRAAEGNFQHWVELLASRLSENS